MQDDCFGRRDVPGIEAGDWDGGFKGEFETVRSFGPFVRLASTRTL